jgi:hypothetical protein
MDGQHQAESSKWWRVSLRASRIRAEALRRNH